MSDYVIEARFELTDKAKPDDTEAKHLSMFNRRAARGSASTGHASAPANFRPDFAPIAEGGGRCRKARCRRGEPRTGIWAGCFYDLGLSPTTPGRVFLPRAD